VTRRLLLILAGVVGAVLFYVVMGLAIMEIPEHCVC
jgi:hypothetical protein